MKQLYCPYKFTLSMILSNTIEKSFTLRRQEHQELNFLENNKSIRRNIQATEFFQGFFKNSASFDQNKIKNIQRVHVCVIVCVFVLRFLFPHSGGKMWALQLILLNGCPSYHLTSWKKTALIQKPWSQITKAFHQHEDADKTKI